MKVLMITLYFTSLRPPTSLTTNNAYLILSTPNDPIIFRNYSVMKIAQSGINIPIYLPSLLFIEKGYQSSFESINLEKEW